MTAQTVDPIGLIPSAPDKSAVFDARTNTRNGAVIQIMEKFEIDCQKQLAESEMFVKNGTEQTYPEKQFHTFY